MKKVQIFVAQHKESEVFINDVYTPLHVGKAISKAELGIRGDNTGDNISELNPYFCELTALYWLWKNVSDVEYVGLCHYRRYFNQEITTENIDELLSGHDIILAEPVVLRSNILSFWYNGLVPEDIDTFYLYMTNRFPDEEQLFKNFFLGRNSFNPANMFVAKKTLIDDYCAWVFNILMDLKSMLPLAGHAREKRILGFFAEALLPYYAFKRKLKVKALPLVSMIGDRELISKSSKLKILKNNLAFKLFNSARHDIQPDRLTSLKIDGILDKIPHNPNA